MEKQNGDDIIYTILLRNDDNEFVAYMENGDISLLNKTEALDSYKTAVTLYGTHNVKMVEIVDTVIEVKILQR